MVASILIAESNKKEVREFFQQQEVQVQERQARQRRLQGRRLACDAGLKLEAG